MQYFRSNGYDVHGAGKIDHNYAERWTDWYVDGKLRYGPMPSWGPFPYNGYELKPDEYTEKFDSVAPHSSMPEVYKLSYFVPLSDVPSTPPDPKTGFKGYTGWYLYSHPYRYVSETDRDPMPDELLADYAEKFFASESIGPTSPLSLQKNTLICFRSRRFNWPSDWTAIWTTALLFSGRISPIIVFHTSAGSGNTKKSTA